MTSTTKHFTIDARTVLQLGRQSIKDPTTALIELVKNAYDADAKVVDIEIDVDQIRVADNGSGMSQGDLEKKWLRIGFSEKRRGRRSPSGKRRVVGEKGVGRISADRLGSDLELRTVAAESGGFSARVDWDAFDVDNRDLASIEIAIRTGVKPRLPAILTPSGSVPATTGTELLITRLRQRWTEDDVEELVEELSTLVAPFQEDIDFQIRIQTYLPDAFKGIIPPFVTEHAPLELRATLDKDRVTYQIIDRTQGNSPRITDGALPWTQIGPRGRSERRSGHSPMRKPRTGPVEIVLYYLPKTALSRRPKGLSLADARRRVLGVRIYRDLVRVRPYGDMTVPEGDWLKLAARKGQDPAGVSRRTYRIPPTELAGAVLISRDENKNLEDSAGREGLIHNDAYNDLRALTLGCLVELEQYRHQIYTAARAETLPPPLLQAVEDFSRQLRSAEREWGSIHSEIATNPARATVRASEVISSVTESLRQTRSSITVVVEQMRLYRGLSTVGIWASVFGHETQSALALALGNLRESVDELQEMDPDIDLLRETVPRAYHAAERVGAWGAFAVARVRHEKRKASSIDIPDLIERLVKELRPAYEATHTELLLELGPVSAHAFEMDLEAILLNLLANAYTFAQEGRGDRAIRVETRAGERNGHPGVLLIVADSGPGIPENRREVIWEPLYTTRRDIKGNEVGTGLGLAIIDSILREVGGTRQVDSDPHLGGARFSIWTPQKWPNV